MASKPEQPSGRLRDRLLWFVAIYCGSAAAFAALIYGLKAIVPR